MSDGRKRYESRRRKLLARKDVYTVNIPVFPDREDSPTFPLTYTDSGDREGTPTLVVIPGGPGFASVLPYAYYRPRIARAGFRVVMVEHRGVGLSRHDAGGNDLPAEAIRAGYAARDILAVLNHLGIEKAWLHGTSYGGYLAQFIGVLDPDRVAGIFLDTTMFFSKDGEAQREHNRSLFLRGESPETAGTAGQVREILDSGEATDEELTEVVPPVYEFLGPRVLERLLRLVAAGRRTEWEFLHRQLRKELDDEADPFVFQFDLAGVVWYRELVPTEPDGMTFDTAKMFAEKAADFPPFEGEPFDPVEALPGFEWPVVLFSGGRDTREPAFLHREMAAMLPHALHVVFPGAAHDLLRFRAKAVLEVEQAAVRGGLDEAERVASEAVVDSSLHPQHTISRVMEGYLALMGVGRRPVVRRTAAVLVLVVLAAFVWRLSRPRGNIAKLQTSRSEAGVWLLYALCGEETVP